MTRRHEPDVWTFPVRVTLCEQTRKRWGPYDGISPIGQPGYRTFCEKFAEAVGAESAEAVEQQIRFAISPNHANSGQSQSSILCKAAALVAGYIRDEHLPH